ncbi:hypothetical protein ACXR0O_29450 [Verrucomicrobiota bacterium sgz303538]
MSLPGSVRSLVPLVIGIAVGGVGAVMFLQSMPGSEGSAEERANKLEVELKRAQNRIAALEAEDSPNSGPDGVIQRIAGGSHGRQRTLGDGTRRIAEALRAGRPVTPDDIFKATQPLMRDLAPLFDRMRVKQQAAMTDSMAGELARKYNLPPDKQAQLRQWFDDKANESAKRWSDMIAADGTRLEDVIRASHDVRPDEGIEAFMPNVLSSEQYASFKAERLAEHARRVEQEADMRVQRLDSIVGLNETQRDQVFGIMARSSRDYDPSMVIEGVNGQIGATPAGDRQAAILSVLSPDQRVAYEAERQRRREAAEKDLAAIGLTLSPNWEMFDDNSLR